MRDQNSGWSFKGLFAYLLPLPLLSSRWTRLDILIYLCDKALLALTLPTFAALLVLVASVARAGLVTLGLPPLTIPYNAVTMLLFLLFGVMLRDFAAFYVHLLQHRVPLLWEFHKVHHAPESLIPLTGHRLHPLDQFVGIATETPLFGMLAGAYAFLTGQDQSQMILCSVGLYSIINILTFSPLRHSHIDLRFGRLERLIMSPAHHHLHHSVEPGHWDKNFGAIFPLWDWLFGTLLEPPPRDSYRLGLPDGKGEDYATVWGCYVTPFQRLGRRLREGGGRWRILKIGPIANGRPCPSPDGMVVDNRID